MRNLRKLDNCPGMIHVQKSMQRYTTIDQMFRKHFMLTLLEFFISGLLAVRF